MDLSLFSVLIGLSLSLVFLGYYSGERAYSLVGFGFLFILASGILLPGNLDLPDGFTETYTYICQECTGNSLPTLTGNVSQVSSIITTPNTTAWNDTQSKFFGIWIMVISAVGVAITTVEIRGGFRK